MTLNPRPPIYDDIFIFGTGEHPVVGDWTRQPDLGRSYLLAARHAIEVAEHDKTLGYVALPVAFLQRHSIELELKRILSAAYSIRQDRDLCARLRRDPNAEPGELRTPPP